MSSVYISSFPNKVVFIPIEVISWSENCNRKIAENNAKIAIGSCSTYKIFNSVISDFNEQE
ncbi:hypothetical protein ST37_00565 [Vibrio sp. qd031]|nr:hypothetical protein ST37_00565 [Vibrio sp. qd031]